jgi:hypothetical protein
MTGRSSRRQRHASGPIARSAMTSRQRRVARWITARLSAVMALLHVIGLAVGSAPELVFCALGQRAVRWWLSASGRCTPMPRLEHLSKHRWARRARDESSLMARIWRPGRGKVRSVPPPVRCCRCCRRGAALVNPASQPDSSVTRRWSGSAVTLVGSYACRAVCVSCRAWARSSRAASRARPAASNRSLAASKASSACFLAARASASASSAAASLRRRPARCRIASRCRAPHNRGCQAGSARRRAGCTARHQATVLAAAPSAPGRGEVGHTGGA